MTPFWPIEHTADLGLLIRAETKSGLFVEAAKGLTLLLVAEFHVVPAGWRQVSVEAPDDDILLADFLSEILALATVEGLAAVEVRDLQLSGPAGERRLTADIGHLQVKDLEGLKQEIKAVTYHGLEIKEIEGGFEATVIFDV